MSVLFKAEDLAPVLAEADATGTELVLAKDQGVYIYAQGGAIADGARTHIAYAVGHNPAVDAFEDWWFQGREEMGGDDFGEPFTPTAAVFDPIRHGTHHLLVRATPEVLDMMAVPARRIR